MSFFRLIQEVDIVLANHTNPVKIRQVQYNLGQKDWLYIYSAETMALSNNSLQCIKFARTGCDKRPGSSLVAIPIAVKVTPEPVVAAPHLFLALQTLAFLLPFPKESCQQVWPQSICICLYIAILCPLHYITLHYIMLCYAMFYYFKIYYIITYYIISLHIILYHYILFYIITYYIISLHIKLYYIILYYIILYYIILYYIVLYYIIL